MFHFCIADTEHDWREGTEQYKFIEHCLAFVDRQKQPWLIFLAHRVLGYSSGISYAVEGSFEEPMGRESLQKLWQKYKVDIAVYGHVHNYERTCPIYQVFLLFLHEKDVTYPYLFYASHSNKEVNMNCFKGNYNIFIVPLNLSQIRSQRNVILGSRFQNNLLMLCICFVNNELLTCRI